MDGYKLTDDQRLRRVDETSLISRKHHIEWLRKIITGDEEAVPLINHSRRKKWMGAGKDPEPDDSVKLKEKRVPLWVLWSFSGVVYWELLRDRVTVTGDICFF